MAWDHAHVQGGAGEGTDHFCSLECGYQVGLEAVRAGFQPKLKMELDRDEA